MSEIVHYIIR